MKFLSGDFTIADQKKIVQWANRHVFIEIKVHHVDDTKRNTPAILARQPKS
jgi:hypothetical protein